MGLWTDTGERVSHKARGSDLMWQLPLFSKQAVGTKKNQDDASDTALAGDKDVLLLPLS